jgi:hypothetical protein
MQRDLGHLDYWTLHSWQRINVVTGDLDSLRKQRSAVRKLAKQAGMPIDE